MPMIQQLKSDHITTVREAFEEGYAASGGTVGVNVAWQESEARRAAANREAAPTTPPADDVPIVVAFPPEYLEGLSTERLATLHASMYQRLVGHPQIGAEDLSRLRQDIRDEIAHRVINQFLLSPTSSTDAAKVPAWCWKG